MEMINISDEEKKVLLDFLGFSVNDAGIVVVKQTGKIHICPFSNEPVRFKDASIMPGSTIVFNTSPLSLVQYFSEYLEDGESQ